MTDRGPGPHDPEDVDRRFREIVAGLQPEAPADHDRDHDQPGPPGAPADPPAPKAVNPPHHLGPGTPSGMATDHRSYEPPESEDDDHFVPPPTPPLPAGDLHFWAIVLGLVGGPLLLLFSAVIPVLSPVWTAVGTLLMLAGFVLLVLRLPRNRRGDDDWGAKV